MRRLKLSTKMLVAELVDLAHDRGGVTFELGLHGGNQARPKLVDLRCHEPNDPSRTDRHGVVAANPWVNSAPLRLRPIIAVGHRLAA